MQYASPGVGIRPLTRVSEKTGEVYRREADVEQQIAELSAMSLPDLLIRVDTAGRDDAGHVKEEALVYLIRENYMRGQRRTVEELSAVLLTRCEGHIRSMLYGLSAEHLEEAEDEVVENLFERILDRTSDRGDFLQVRFWTFLTRLATDASRKHLTLMKKTARDVAPEWIHGAEPADEPQGDTHYVAPVAAGGLNMEERVLLNEALASLDEPYRTLVVLRHYYDWPIEGDDPDVPTISGYFGRTPRTIRNWMNTAQDRLRAWREGEL
jgi:DNA-directed RNA polymerase specialized sigma24 family protein